jgi:hypothetical protein
MKLRAIVCLLFAGLPIICAPAVLATKIIHMNPEKLAANSSTVVRGTVTLVESFRNASGTKIFTETVIAVDESYKGDPGNEVRLLQLGGVVDGVQVTVHGALHWTHGEEIVVFLEPYQGGRFHVAGFSQGKFKVERDPVTGRAFINRPALEGVELVDDDGNNHSDITAVTRVPLDQFLSKALGNDYRPSDR